MFTYKKKATQTLTNRSQEVQIQFNIPRGSEMERQINVISLTEADLALIKLLEPIINQNIDSIVDGFYENITRQPNLHQIIEIFSTVDRLKMTFKSHIMEMFVGNINNEFVNRRVQIANVHVKVGLNTKWYISAFQNLLNFIIKLLEENIENRVDLVNAILAISKLLNFEQQLVLEAYEQEMERYRQIEEEKRNKILQVGSTAENLAAIAEETSASIEYLTSQSAAIVSLSKQGTEQAIQAESYSNKGMTQLQKSQESLELTKKSVEDIIANSKELEHLSIQINEVVSIIESISDQTSLLSLNAAIESARAGEYGRGFGVVANEIRKLSEQTKDSISDVSILISETNIQVNNVTSSIYGVGEIIQKGSNIMLETNHAFEEIIEAMEKYKEQNYLIENEINSFIEIIKEISSASSQVATIADGLNQATQELHIS